MWRMLGEALDLQLFQRSEEVEVTRALSHPNIVRVVGSVLPDTADILNGRTSEVFILRPL
jgi:hypothetical protein